MCCFVILLLFNEMQMNVRRFPAIPHLRGVNLSTFFFITNRNVYRLTVSYLVQRDYERLSNHHHSHADKLHELPAMTALHKTRSSSHHQTTRSAKDKFCYLVELETR